MAGAIPLTARFIGNVNRVASLQPSSWYVNRECKHEERGRYGRTASHCCRVERVWLDNWAHGSNSKMCSSHTEHTKLDSTTTFKAKPINLRGNGVSMKHKEEY
eukprot:CAMPEP_0119338012 /NCGR_PEP_ID=MMETSP1333-20130426/95164_1 /TAXON_ID=418940 /ORGANISM="Scyphosphaera apsteinii, Strain RCC1455" /LENGTH=102 /DNA_ID=CAMNT_0007349187 /DNA_START=97 /DNA_END=406 /DNA_ORIENTATION=-